jgi:HEAT repeats
MASAAVVIVGAVVVATIACATDGDAQPSGHPTRVIADDTAALARLLRVVRGSDPLVCEMATRNADMHGHWSMWDLPHGNPLEVDSASGALLDWIQNEHNDPALIPVLRAGLRDGDACVRRVSAAFLGRVKNRAASEALVSALEDQTADTRRVAALGLGMSDDTVGVAQLTRHLRDDSPSVRRAAAWALGEMKATQAEDALISLLTSDPEPLVRQAAAWALGHLEQE